MTTSTYSRTKINLIFAALLLIFIGPAVAAWSFYTAKAPVLQTVNYGDLLTPPLQLSQLSLQNTDGSVFSSQVLQKHWLMLYISPVNCDKLCELNLYKMRQVRLALGKNQERMQRMLITYPQTAAAQLDTELAQQYQGTYHAVVQQENMQQFLGKSLFGTLNSAQGGLFIADPLGNVMMYYAPDADPENILKDLTRLLGVSQIG